LISNSAFYLYFNKRAQVVAPHFSAESSAFDLLFSPRFSRRSSTSQMLAKRLPHVPRLR